MRDDIFDATRLTAKQIEGDVMYEKQSVDLRRSTCRVCPAATIKRGFA
jgi:hypothetical protein